MESLAREVSKTLDMNEKERRVYYQLGYYFGDINLVKDDFMKKTMEANNGWIPISVILTFKRLAAVNTRHEDIVSAVENTDICNIIEINEDKTMLRRSVKNPIMRLDASRRMEIMNRTLYIRGFELSTNMDELLSVFMNYNIEALKLLRTFHKPSNEWTFNGSIFATFKTFESARKYIMLSNNEVSATSSNAKMVETKKQIMTGKNKYGKKYATQSKKEEERRQFLLKKTAKLPRGTILKLTCVPDTLNEDFIQDLVDWLGGEVRFVKLVGDTAWVRLAMAGQAYQVYGNCQRQLCLNGYVMNCRVLHDLEELEYLYQVTQEVRILKQNKKWRRLRNRNEGNGN